MKNHPHGNKLEGRIKNEKFIDERKLLQEISIYYKNYKEKCMMINPNDSEYIKRIVRYTNEYVNLLSDDKFTSIKNNSQSQLYPSIMEEFMFYIFKNIIKPPLVRRNGNIPITAYFKPYHEIINCNYFEQSLCLETFNVDFVIGIIMKYAAGKKDIIYPLVIIENKRYADKTMRRSVEYAAMKLKKLAPDCLFLVVVDLLRSFFDKWWSPKLSAFDQIYGLKEGNDDNIREDVVLKLVTDVQLHLMKVNNVISLEDRYKRGYMMDNG